MGIIGGMCNLDGRPVDEELFQSFLRSVPLFNQDKEAIYTSGNIALGSRLLDLTAESVLEKQPVSNGAGSCHIVMEGRVDNRESLVCDLGLCGPQQVEKTDAALILKAYEAWGTDCAKRIIGHFAFAIWDDDRKRLLCVKDALGVRPLFYYKSDRKLLFGSQVQQFFADAEVPRTLNEEYLGDFLVTGMPVGEATPFKGITRLPAGHSLVIENGNVRQEQYWDFEEKTIHYQKDEEYEEHLLTLFREGVRSCLRSSGPVWADLSGGLDSSSIVCMAQEIYKQGGAENRGFSTITIVFDEAKTSDEWEWCLPVIEKYQLDARKLPGDTYYPFKDSLEGASSWDEPSGQIVFYQTWKRYAEMLGEAETNVLLSGTCAEMVVLTEDPEPIHLADYLRRLELKKFKSQLNAWQKALKTPLAGLLLNCCLKPLIDRRLTLYAPRRWHAVPSWVNRSFAKKFDLEDKLRHGGAPPKFKSAADQWAYEKIRRIPGFLVRGHLERACDVRYPFLYRPLLEFAQAVPWERRIRPGINKYLMRRAMRGILPEAVRRRPDKRGPGHSAYLGMAKEWKNVEEVVRSSMLVSLGIFDQKEFLRVTELVRHGYALNMIMYIWTMSLEYWLRSLHDRNKI